MRRGINQSRWFVLGAVLVLTAISVPQIGCELFISGTVNVPDDDDNTNDNDDTTGRFVVFTDEATGFSTTDVRDVDEEIVRFDAETKAIVWAADDTSYQEGLWTVDGVFLAGGGFQVRFGTKDGEQRAYFTETGPATICQIEASEGGISISPTSVTVPQE